MAIEHVGKNKYKLVVDVGKGKNRKRRVKRVEASGKREAIRLYAEFEAEVLNAYAPAGYTVRNLLNDYIDAMKIAGLSETTLHGYNTIKSRIFSFLGDEIATEVNSYAVQNFVVKMANKPYSPKTIKSTIGLLSAAYNRAVKLGELTSNPCQAVDIPKQQRPEIITLAPDDIPRFMQCLDHVEIDLRAAVMLALFCGLRRSEILGLTASDVNLPFKCLTVKRSRHVVDGADVIREPKTKRSRRTLALPPFVCDVLAELIEAHAKQDFETCDALIQNGFGQPLNPQALASRLARFEKRNELPSVSLHGLRHTYATLLINSGVVDIAQVSAELGHSNVSTTLNVYMELIGGAGASSKAVASATETIFNNAMAPTTAPTQEKNAATR